MVASTGSGRGKTTYVTGLLYALKNDICKDNTLHAFKCGPDYIDPMFHKEVLSIESTNLDPFFCDEKMLSYVFKKNAADINVIEAAMGLYDGIGTTKRASAYDVAKALKCPIILLVDGQGMGYSIVPMIKGFLADDSEHLIKGIVINRISEKYYQKIAPVIEAETGVEVFGFISKVKGAELSSRHLGLVFPYETEFSTKIKLISDEIKANVNINKILESCPANFCVDMSEAIPKAIHSPKKIAIAKDEAFNFFYKENIDLLIQSGAEITYFSPIHDKQVPDDSDVIILYGGYPENYAKELADNLSMISSIRDAYSKGVKIVAECGGFMYLLDTMDVRGKLYNMAGIIKGHSYRTKGLVRFGYVNVEGNGHCIKAHEFHHYDTQGVEYSNEYTVRNEASSETYMGIVKTDNLFAGFPHMYYLSCIDFVKDVVLG